MKKIILLLTLMYAFNCKAQFHIVPPIADTAKYLKDSIVPKTSYYIGKPLNVLLKDLKVKVKSYIGVIPFDYLPDTIEFKETTLSFISISSVSFRIKTKMKTPNIYIKFVQPLYIPKQYFKQGYFLENSDWDTYKNNYFGQFIISSLEVRGI